MFCPKPYTSGIRVAQLPNPKTKRGISAALVFSMGVVTSLIAFTPSSASCPEDVLAAISISGAQAVSRMQPQLGSTIF
jgi:hypothetical protein